ncbi:DUF3318 domain-containing protein [Stenomitos frigidus]|nr:DUF3318 domain-containing protein [Stenomitos frigidus]
MLLPDALKYCVTIAQSLEVKPALIQTQQLKKRRFEIQIDLLRWQFLEPAQRDLLFWHEVARIQGRAIAHNQNDWVMLGVGLGAALINTAMQNVLLLSGSLLIAGLAGYQLYQRNHGERNLKKATAADQAAIGLAIQFGYDFPSAYENLHSALTTLANQAPHNAQRVRYEARQNVLEIFARHHNGCADTGSANAGDRACASRPPLPLHAQSRPKASAASERYFSF